MKPCTTCKELKPLNEFSRNRANRDGLRVSCKDCEKIKYRVGKDSFFNFPLWKPPEAS